ncbi:MAG: aldehyde reductase [Myxococcaceae bacterium]
MSQVLVTGGTGFVGAHVAVRLLDAGHTVRATVRSKKREADVREMVKNGGASDAKLSVVEADLTSDAGWAEAMAGCDYVMHVASPLPAGEPKDPDELIRPAVDGVLRVLKFARDAKVKRVVFTSTCGAIYYGHPKREKPFDETDWTNLDGQMSTYVRSKALAERAAWDFMKKEGGALELSVVNPSGIFGPALAKDYSSSLELIGRLLNGMSGVPRLFFSVVDVRDVAELHLLAMTAPEAKGERFIASSGRQFSMMEIARLLRQRLGPAASKVPTREMPDWVVRVVSTFKSELKPLLPLLSNVKSVTSEKAQRVLGWKPRPPEEALLATAESLIHFGMIAGAPAALKNAG